MEFLSEIQTLLNPLHRLYIKKSCNFLQSYEKLYELQAFSTKNKVNTKKPVVITTPGFKKNKLLKN